jgi:cysteinyl-tRNA synthetase
LFNKHNKERVNMTTIDTQLAEVLTSLELLQAETMTEGSLNELVRRLDLCQRMTSNLRDKIDELNEDIASRMEDDTATITGVGVVQRKARTSSTWLDDSSRERMMDDAISAIVRRVAVDPATGEMYAPIANAAREVWRLTQDAFSFGADPKTAFRKVLGLAPDEYRAKRVTGYTISITEGE